MFGKLAKLLCPTACSHQIYSGFVDESAGFDSPTSLPDVSDWTVFKQSQTEIYVITHNLGLADPERDLHVVATPADINTIIVIQNLEANAFTLSTWGAGSEPTPKSSAFSFVAIDRR